ncbi:hypothetical protein [Desulfurobacterium sp.]
MKEIESIWPFQELFVDPEVVLKTEKGKATVNLKTAVSIKKAETSTAVIVEIFGSITEGKRQIANIRFVNVSRFKKTVKMQKNHKLLNDIVKKKVNEFISFLPAYLTKAGIFVESIKYEEDK